MPVTFDPAKRLLTLRERGLDFRDAEQVFEGPRYEFEDIRKNYGEPRYICVGYLEGRMVIVGFTPRGADRHIFSMRKANDREKNKYAPLTILRHEKS